MPQNLSKSCIGLFFEFTSQLANIVTVYEWLESLWAPSSKHLIIPLTLLDNNPLLSGIILFYGLTGISFLIWHFLAQKFIGEVQAAFYALILYLLGSAIVIYSYGNTFYPSDFPSFLFSWSTFILFIFFPYIVGRVVLNVNTTHRNTN